MRLLPPGLLCVLAAVSMFMPIILLIIRFVEHGNLSGAVFSIAYMSPLGMVVSFAIGTLCASLARFSLQQDDAAKKAKSSSTLLEDEEGAARSGETCTANGSDVSKTSRRLRGLLADVCLIIMLTITFGVPLLGGGGRSGDEVFFVHALAPLFGLFFYGVAAGEGSYFGAMLSHPALAAPGDFSFTVYLIQSPLSVLWRKASKPQNLGSGPISSEVGFILLIWLVAGLYTHYVDNVVHQLIRSATQGWV